MSRLVRKYHASKGEGGDHIQNVNVRIVVNVVVKVITDSFEIFLVQGREGLVPVIYLYQTVPYNLSNPGS